MKKPNVVILVIDTLREDYASGLEPLRELGFVRYENAIAPAPWTLPSHASLITGMYPSQHEIHEAYGVYVDRELMEISKQRLNALSHGILGEVMDEGYSTYILSANPFLSPLYGFTKYTEILITGYDYTPYKKYNEYVEYEKLQSMTKDHGYIGTALKLIKEENLSLLNKAIKFYVKRRITKLATKLGIYDPTMEKGSHIIIDYLNKKKLNEPFLLLNTPTTAPGNNHLSLEPHRYSANLLTNGASPSITNPLTLPPNTTEYRAMPLRSAGLQSIGFLAFSNTPGASNQPQALLSRNPRISQPYHWVHNASNHVERHGMESPGSRS